MPPSFLYRGCVVWHLLSLMTLALVACGAPSVSATTIEPPATSTTVAPTSSSSSSSSSSSTVTSIADAVVEIDVEVEGGEVRRGGGRHTVDQGARVRIRVEADTSDEVHVHGYDLFAEVHPDHRAELEFTADIPGIFEVELEEAHLLLFELQVE